jgi:hypothetical protein
MGIFRLFSSNMSSANPLQKIVSGAQTGVDRAALDAAIFLEIPHGGWCPKGRRAEDGVIPDRYELKETTSRDYSVRTEQNVIDSDGTMILFRDEMSGGTLLTLKLAQKHHRPFLCIDLDEFAQKEDLVPSSILNWIADQNIGVLNVAGPRESSSPGIGKMVEAFLVSAWGTRGTILGAKQSDE